MSEARDLYDTRAEAAEQRAEAAEQRAEAAESALAAARAEVTRLRAIIADEAAELPVWPEGAYQTPTERDVSAVRAALYAALGLWQAEDEAADQVEVSDG